MVNKLKIMAFTICLAGTVAFRADAQQTTLLTASGSGEGYTIRQEIKSLLDQEEKLHAQLKISEDKMKPLYDQINQLVLEIKPLKEKADQTNGDLRSINRKIKIDQERLRHLPRN